MGIITDTFILKNETARHLYEAYAKNLPIIDYHSHVDPKEIAEDRKYETITQVWLGGDHYKWRLIRSNGVAEEEITGSADAYTKFRRFAEALPKAIGNPMYHWTHMELKTYFGYDGILNAET
ncbi:MAG: glucuronate isomerase, partial [Oscillospiraceae bacterium]|nr:glucuronate isomerase [Oscillospiraceae bacterium]